MTDESIHQVAIRVGSTTSFAIAVCKAVIDSDGTECWSLCDFDRGLILLSADLSGHERRRALRQQVWHAFNGTLPGERRTSNASAKFHAYVSTEFESQLEQRGGWPTIDALFDAHHT